MTQTFALKSKMPPLEREEKFKTDFFEVSPDIIKKARYATNIADPKLGDEWWRLVQQFINIISV